MNKVMAILCGLLFAGAGALADETHVILDAACPTAPDVVLDQITFCNNSPINIAGPGAASVYPSLMIVAGVSGVIVNLEVRMVNVSHSNTSTLQAVLKPPTGSPIGLIGSGFTIVSPELPAAPQPVPVATSANWTFSDHAYDYALFFRNGAPILNNTAPVAGTYLPRTFAMANLPAPAPTALESQLLSSQIGRNPNGNWQLFVNQVSLATAANPQPTGTIAGGWCMDITTVPATKGCYSRTEMTGAIDINDATQSGRINRNAIPSLCTWPRTNALFNSTPIHYDAFNITNSSSQQTCYTLTADFNGCASNSTQPVVYTTFNPANPGNNVLADAGYSTTAKIQTSFKRGAGESFTIVAHEIVANSGCPAYTLVLERNPCNTSPIGDVIFRNGFN